LNKSYLEKQENCGASTKQRKLPRQLKPSQRNSDRLNLPFGHD